VVVALGDTAGRQRIDARVWPFHKMTWHLITWISGAFRKLAWVLLQVIALQAVHGDAC
jgi:hypothetical protein